MVYRGHVEKGVVNSTTNMTKLVGVKNLTIEENAIQRQFYISTVSIWRVCNALCRLVDMQSPILSN